MAALERVPSRLCRTVIGRSTLEGGLAALRGVSGLPFRLPEPDELPSVPDEMITLRLDVSAHRDARIAAMRAHATQIALWWGRSHSGRSRSGPSRSGIERSGAGRFALAMSNLVAQPLLDVEEYMIEDMPAGSTDLFARIES